VMGISQVPDLVRRYAEPARHLPDLELTSLEELRILGRKPDLLPFERGFKDRNPVGVGQAAVGRLPLLPETLPLLAGERALVSEYPARPAPAPEPRCAEPLDGRRVAERFPR